MPFTNNTKGDTHFGTYNDVGGNQYNKIVKYLFNVQSTADLLMPVAVKGAAYNSHARYPLVACSEDTRKNLLDEIRQWSVNPTTDKPIFWIHGAAGLGKSAIAQSVAEDCAKQKNLAASFFFAKNDNERNNPRQLFNTIAYQICLQSKAYDHRARCILDKERDAPYNSPAVQLQKLIIEPLIDPIDIPKVVVIDSLDECGDNQTLEEIIPLLFKASLGTPLRFFITSRMNACIQNLVEAEEEHTHSVDLFNYDADDDIRLFYLSRLKQLGTSRGLGESWFTGDDLSQLVDTSGKLFLYAATVIKFIESARQHNPLSQLRAALNVEPTQSNGIYGKLDALYRGILAQIPSDAYDSLTRRVIGTICFTPYPLSPSNLDDLLGVEQGDSWQSLQDLHAFFQVPDIHDTKSCVQLVHTFFRDFISTPQRSGQYAIEIQAHHSYLLCRCLDLMVTGLKRNICDLAPSGNRKDVFTEELIRQRRGERISDAMEYACRCWYYHFKNATIDTNIVDKLQKFTEATIFHWVEVMSILVRMDEVLPTLQGVRSLPDLPKLLKKRIQDFEQIVVRDLISIRDWPLNLYLRFEPRKEPVKKPSTNVPKLDVVPEKKAPVSPESPKSPPLPVTPQSAASLGALASQSLGYDMGIHVQAATRVASTTDYFLSFPEPCIPSSSARNPDIDTFSLSDSIHGCDLLSPPLCDPQHESPRRTRELFCAFCLEDVADVVIQCVTTDEPLIVCENCLEGPLRHGQIFCLYVRSNNRYTGPTLKLYAPVCGHCRWHIPFGKQWMHCIGCQHTTGFDLCLPCYRYRSTTKAMRSSTCEFIDCAFPLPVDNLAS